MVLSGRQTFCPAATSRNKAASDKSGLVTLIHGRFSDGLRMLWTFSGSSNARTSGSRSQPPRPATFSRPGNELLTRSCAHQSCATRSCRRSPIASPACASTSIVRRGKYLLFDCESARGGGWLIIHLGMSGSLRLVSGAKRRTKTRPRRPRLCRVRRCAFAIRGVLAR